ncbi:MAG: XRE family transcriptional regulator [Cytophagales bacterium]|nr:MAG: XRE family transcriptional regulator [Cytophagales bacterium]
MEVGQRIKKLRELRNFSQKYMADALNITQQNYSKMESGEVDFPISRLFNIADLLSVKPNDILSFDEKAIFNYNNQAETITNGFVMTNEKIFEKLTLQYESRIKDLQREVDRLHLLLEKAFSK